MGVIQHTLLQGPDLQFEDKLVLLAGILKGLFVALEGGMRGIDAFDQLIGALAGLLVGQGFQGCVGCRFVG